MKLLRNKNVNKIDCCGAMRFSFITAICYALFPLENCQFILPNFYYRQLSDSSSVSSQRSSTNDSKRHSSSIDRWPSSAIDPRLLGGAVPIHQTSPKTEWDVTEWWRENVREDFRSILRQLPGNNLTNARQQSDQSIPFVISSNHHRNDLDYSESSVQSSSSSIPGELRSGAKRKVLFDKIPFKNSLSNRTSSVFDNDQRFWPPGPPSLNDRSSTNHTKTFRKDLNQEQSESQRADFGTNQPKSSLNSIKSLFLEYFSNVRTNLFDSKAFTNLKRNLRSQFLDYDLQTAIQTFYSQKRRDKGHNIIGIYPSIHRETAKKDLDSILVIGAHYDTVSRSPGVEDNGSGSVAVLELARLLQKNQCKLNTTIIFVLFDMEEDGLVGSKHFVRNYLIPVEMYQNHVPIKGAIIMDMLLEYDPNPNSQITQGIGHLLPEWNDQVKQNRYRADFTAVWARRDIDFDLFKIMQDNWLNVSKYKLFLMDPPLPKLGRELTSGLTSKKLRPYSTFLRSDHSSFWYPHSFKNETINAILLTDLGPWRRKVANKYHSSADNRKLLSRSNLLFLKNAIDSLMRTILHIGDGHCKSIK
ncbi:Leupeptin-inactivating enzyme 1 [Sarcoptes scabiei]|uniref:Leupeptin-inactivating enzyme 1 n=2 Tax=Sarcoptes scabiei TaxID=52283 RepID=A0A834RCM6_SARSC|nr:Leupeptin-inactivating enzyme 1 [Sarcoptes scabiei]